MSDIALQDAEVFQWGIESTPGTAVAATSVIDCESGVFTPIDNPERPRIRDGVLGMRASDEFVTHRGSNFLFQGFVNFGQLQSWLNMIVGLDAAPAGTDPYTWTHVYDPTASPIGSLQHRTFERQLNDLGGNVLDHEWAYGTGNRLVLSADVDGGIRYQAGGFCRRRQSSTFTASQALPTSVKGPHALARVFLDTTWGGIGGTVVSGQTLGWEIEIDNGLRPQRVGDARTDLDFSFPIVETPSIRVRVTMLSDLSSGQLATEITAAQARTQRAMQLHYNGPGAEDLKLDLLGTHELADIDELGEVNGQKVFDLNLMGAGDGTNLMQATLINNVAAGT